MLHLLFVSFEESSKGFIIGYYFKKNFSNDSMSSEWAYENTESNFYTGILFLPIIIYSFY